MKKLLGIIALLTLVSCGSNTSTTTVEELDECINHQVCETTVVEVPEVKPIQTPIVEEPPVVEPPVVTPPVVETPVEEMTQMELLLHTDFDSIEFGGETLTRVYRDRTHVVIFQVVRTDDSIRRIFINANTTFTKDIETGETPVLTYGTWSIDTDGTLDLDIEAPRVGIDLDFSTVRENDVITIAGEDYTVISIMSDDIIMDRTYNVSGNREDIMRMTINTWTKIASRQYYSLVNGALQASVSPKRDWENGTLNRDEITWNNTDYGVSLVEL